LYDLINFLKSLFEQKLIKKYNGKILVLWMILFFISFLFLIGQDPVSTTYDDGVGTLDDIGGM